MCLFHKWSKWEIIYQNGNPRNYADGFRSIVMEVVQKKQCTKCGYVKFDITTSEKFV